MIATFIIGFICMFLAFLAWNQKSTKFLLFAFVILYIFLALRYNFGSDYMTYYSLFNDIRDSSWSYLKGFSNLGVMGETMEFGYIYLNKVFSTFSGFFFFIAFHSLLLCMVYFSLIKKYVNIQYAWLALFILIFHTSLLVRSLSGLRQALAIFCFLYSIKYLLNRKFLKYALCILLATTFHYSAIILLPLFFIFSTKSISRFEPFVYITLYVLTLFLGKFILNSISDLTSLLTPKYLYYIQNIEEQTLESGIGFLLTTFLYIIILFFSKKDTSTDRVFYRIVAVFIVLSPASFILSILDRLSLYFAPALVVVIPQLLTINHNKLLKTIFIAVLLFITLYSYIAYNTSPIFFKTNYSYHSIFSS
jgi:hypothetical protein